MIKALLVAALLFPLTSFAVDMNATAMERSDKTLSSVRESSDDDMALSASRWGLSVDEWQRYEEIMKGEGRYNWNNSDPITVLGIYAETNEERERYAERLAIQEYTLNKRFLALNNAYLAAFKRLYGEERVMDMDKFYDFYQTTPPSTGGLLNNTDKSNVSVGDRFILFVSPGCNGCDRSFRSLRRAQKSGMTLDVYFVGASDQEIIDWAEKMAIDPSLVKNKIVTLNQDGEMYARYNRPPLPAAFYYSLTGGSVQPIDHRDIQ